jgi:hypothetical protein
MYPAEPLQPSDVGLILSYKCQSACAHCLYNCGPKWKEWMSPEMVKAALESMNAWNHPFQVHLTGGEPFLNFLLLLQATEIAVALGIPCYLETNAGWCVHEDVVAERFNVLRQVGLQAILISCSPFHAETIPVKNTLLAIHKAMDIFGSPRVIVYLPEWLEQVRHFGIEKPTPLERYIQEYGAQKAGELFWEGYGLISGGRSGYRLGYLANKLLASSFRGQSCRTEILYAHHSHFDLYGNYISSFCGGLTIGSWQDLPRLLAYFRAEKYPSLIEILVHSGPYGLYQLARDEYGYTPLEEGYVGKCHLCVDVRRWLVQSSDFRELRPTEFYARI